MTPLKTTTGTADEGADLLAQRIQEQLPTFFFRFGDGALECMQILRHEVRSRGETCDGERYSKPLADALLLDTWCNCAADSRVFVGDWLTATFIGAPTHEREWQVLLNCVDLEVKLLHFESLLLMRRSEALVSFYRTVRDSRQRKLFMGPAWNSGAAAMLGAEFLEVPTRDLFNYRQQIVGRLNRSNFDVLLYGAGMAGNVFASDAWQVNPNRTYLNLGSAMDPLFYRRTRKQQLTTAAARQMFRELV